jgi:hypothetical protein
MNEVHNVFSGPGVACAALPFMFIIFLFGLIFMNGCASELL